MVLGYLDLQSSQNSGLHPKMKGVWAFLLATLEVTVVEECTSNHVTWTLTVCGIVAFRVLRLEVLGHCFAYFCGPGKDPQHRLRYTPCIFQVRIPNIIYGMYSSIQRVWGSLRQADGILSKVHIGALSGRKPRFPGFLKIL